MNRLAAMLLFAALPAAAQLQESITVERVLVDARVTDSQGTPIRWLTASDFHVKVDGKPATVESVDWIAESRSPSDAKMPAPHESVRPRLLVYLFQQDFGRASIRTGGHMKVLLNAEQWIDFLEPEDRVAVLSYDSHLKFRLDFTRDRNAIAAAMRRSLWFDDPPKPQPGEPSLHLDPAAMKNAGTIETALLLVGKALREIDGAKSLILFGWGIGRTGKGGFWLNGDYNRAAYTLQNARVTVFSVDITQASGHSLAAGLNAVAGDTGGTYVSTGMFSKKAFGIIRNALSGHYELEVRKPRLTSRGAHAIEVNVARRDANVMARSWYADD